jgi:hypothetical protein
MYEENVVFIHSGVLFSHKEESNYIIYRKMDGTREHHVEQDKPNSKSKISCFHSYAEPRLKMVMMITNNGT